MKNRMFQTICAIAAFAVTTAHAWDPNDLEERHEKAQEAKDNAGKGSEHAALFR